MASDVCDAELKSLEKRGPGRPKKCGTPVTNNIMLIKCDDCGKMYRSGIMMRRHIAKSHPHKLKTFCCKLCDIAFDSKDKLLRHTLSQHWNANSVCPLSDECDFKNIFIRSATLRTHLLKKHTIFQDIDESENIQIKTICESKSKKNHHRCQICSKSFPKQSLLERHIRIHTGEKPFNCCYCNSNFNQKSTLKTHILSHINSLPYKCPYCVARFNQRGNLMVHVEISHPPIVSPDYVKCRYCSCVFKQNRHLILHITKFHQNLTEDQMINDTIDDVMKNLTLLREHSMSNIESSICNLESSNCKSTNNFTNMNNILNENWKQRISSNDKFKNINNNSKQNKACVFIDEIKYRDNNQDDSIQKKQNDADKKKSKRFPKDLLLGTVNCNVPSIPLTSNSNDALNKNDITMQTFEDIIPGSPLQSSAQLLPSDINITNDDTNMHFDLNLSESMLNRSNADIDISLLLNTSDSFEIENMPMDSNIFGGLMNFNQPNSIANDNNLPEQNKTILDNSNSFENDIIQNNLESNANDNDLMKSNSILLNTETFNIDPSNEFNNTLNFTPMNVDKENIYISSNDISTHRTPSFSVTIEEPNQALPGISDNPTDDIDMDILKLMSENSIMLDVNNEKTSKTQESDQEDIKLKNDLKTLKNILQLNKRTIKNPPLNYRCEFCSASFAKYIDFERHKRTHTGEKPFACEICKKVFSLKSSLKSHQQTHLSKDQRQKHPCPICGKLYSTKSALSLHKSIHVGNRPYNCPLCPFTCRTPGNRDSHIKSHFKNKNLLRVKNKIQLLNLPIEL